MAEINILGHRQIVKEDRLLVDGRDSLREGVMGGRQCRRATIEQYGALPMAAGCRS